MECLEAEGVSQADGMAGRGGRQAEPAMKVQLLMRRKLVGRPEIDEMRGAAALGKVAGVFNVRVPGAGELAVEVGACLAGEVVPA